MNTHTIYGLDLSYFTRKTEAAFQLHQIEHRFKSKTMFNRRRVESGGRTGQVPVIRLPNGDWMADSTPIIEHLDTLSTTLSLFPDGRSGILPRLCEEWLDEWFPRVVIHFRWNYPECSTFAKAAIAKQLLPFLPGPLRGVVANQVETWGRKAVRALALDSLEQQQRAEGLFHGLMSALDRQLQETRFSLGNRPCAVDAVLLGAVRAHLGADPEPARHLETYPRVLEWVASPPSWSAGDEFVDLSELGPFADFVLTQFGGQYSQWIQGNARALKDGQKAFVISAAGQDVSYRARAYSETSRARLARWLDGLTGDDAVAANEILVRYHLASVFSLD